MQRTSYQMVPATAAPGAGGAPSMRRIPEGQYTATVYTYIRDGKYAEVIRLLSQELLEFPKSRAALSLLAYCSYMIQDYISAAKYYESLVKLFPEVDEYRLYYAQCLYKSAQYAEATRTAHMIENVQFAQRVTKLKANISYEQGDIEGARSFLDHIPDDADTVVNLGCLLFKEGSYEEARAKFTEALNSMEYQPQLVYNIALCYYKQKQYGLALKHVAEIIERGIQEHPELSVGSNADGVEAHSVGNTSVLLETALIEAFNLKAAIEYLMKNEEAAREALANMPPRAEEELDPVTLHNQALMNMEADPANGFRKLNYLLSSVPCPQETFCNLLILYCKYQHYDLAADVMAENSQLTYDLPPEVYEFMDATIMSQSAPDEAYRKFEDLAKKHTETLRKLTKQVQDARLAHDNEGVKRAVKDYDIALEKYIPVLMSQARIYWELQNYEMVEKLFRQSAEFCSEHDIWKLNVAHVFFMQEAKYKEAIRYYDPVVKKQQDEILQIPAMILANLCVSYIMTSQNEEAEELMRRIEREEERVIFNDGEKKTYHLCIVNLVIGTLYCAKGNFEFGISRVIKSLEPFDKKLGTDTW
eukprot:TRINITY_DN624_c0_g1_i1.p1 TRINITY_DN624_c0_g1~~TRINITY_DN624_c0_g1_i1.p1  ORF type:complete len:588 (+),score=134.86 TRINITY_DN624_c0_g1_i1:261-2024(+)